MPHANSPENDVPDLWPRILDGDVASFGVWHARYDPRVQAFLRSRCRPPVDPGEIAQQVWMLVWERRHQWNPQRGAFLSWLFQIASNQRNTELRKRQRRPEQALPEGIDPVAVQAAEDDERMVAMRECLKELGGSFVEVLKLRLIEELNDAQIAERFGVTVAAVYSRASRGRDDVRQCIERKLA